MADFTCTVPPPLVYRYSLSTSSGTEAVPEAAPLGLSAVYDTARSGDWADVSVKEEPVDWSQPMSLQQQEQSNGDDFDEDHKDHIPANSLGEVHYLTTEQDVKQEEEGMGYVSPLTIEPIKEEDNDPQEFSGSAVSNDLSYLDDPRLSMSPCDYEIDPPQCTIFGKSLQPNSTVTGKSTSIKKSLKVKSRVQSATAKITKSRDKQSKQKSQIVGYQKPGPKCSKVSKTGCNSKRTVAKKKQKALMQSITLNPMSKFVPCVVQLCEIPQCGIDCRCTVKAPFPHELKAVTLSTSQNVKSLCSASEKGVNTQSPVSNKSVSISTQTVDDIPKEGEMNPSSVDNKTKTGKRKTKLSKKLKEYMEERKKLKEAKLKVKKRKETILPCPICKRQLNNLHNFKRHLISHNIDDILNINLCPKNPAEKEKEQRIKEKKKKKKKRKNKGAKVNKEKASEQEEVTGDKNPDKPRVEDTLSIALPLQLASLPSSKVSPVGSQYTAIRALLEDQPQVTTPTPKPALEQTIEPTSNEMSKTDKPYPVVLNIPQFKAASLHKKDDPHVIEEVSVSVDCGQVITFESGIQTAEATVTIGLPESDDICTENKSAEKMTETDRHVEQKECDGNLSNTSNVFVIAPINDFSPATGLSSVEKETDTAQEDMVKDKTVGASVDCQIVSKTNESKKRPKRLSFDKSKKTMKMQLPNESNVIKKSTRKNLKEPILQDLSQALLNGNKSKSSESDNDSDATAPYGDDEDDKDEDYIPAEKREKPWSKVARKSTGGKYWMKKFSRDKIKIAIKGKGKKTKSTFLESTVVSETKQSNVVISKPAKKTTKIAAKQGDVLNTSEDRDSGIDLESDGSEKKKSPKKFNPELIQIQMLSGELVSRKELWTCVDSRLQQRKQREPIMCPMCDKAFDYPSALKRHVMMHTDEREFKCEYCPKAFSRKPHLTEHIRIHTGERPFKCSSCPAAFAQRTNLMIHNRTHTGVRPFKCPECDKRFRRQDAHTQHILTHHSKVKPYKCDECTAAFPCARYLKDHLRVHSKERPFKCQMCDAAFVCKKYLLLHVRALHLNERPFTCKICPAKFAQSGKLTEHNRVHTGEKPYKCSSCGSRFSRSGHLRRHLLTHTGIRPHKCTQCPAKFTQQDHLKRHCKNMHKGG